MLEFAGMDSTQRSVLLAALFLLTLSIGLWAYYDSDGRRRGAALFLVLLLGLSVVATVPALVASTFSLDVDQRDILDPLGTVSVAATAIGVLSAIGYLAFGRREIEFYEEDDTVAEPRDRSWDEETELQTQQGSSGGDFAPTETLRHDEPTIIEGHDSPPTETLDPTRAGVHDDRRLDDDQTRIVRKAPDELAYVAIRTGPRAGRIFRLEGDTNIGRSGDNEIPLSDDSISRRHARIRQREGQWTLWDLDSTNGTFVEVSGDRRRVEAPVPLSDGDRIVFGTVEAQFVFVNTKVSGAD